VLPVDPHRPQVRIVRTRPSLSRPPSRFPLPRAARPRRHPVASAASCAISAPPAVVTMSHAVAMMKGKQVLALTLVAVGSLTCLYVSFSGLDEKKKSIQPRACRPSHRSSLMSILTLSFIRCLPCSVLPSFFSTAVGSTRSFATSSTTARRASAT